MRQRGKKLGFAWALGLMLCLLGTSASGAGASPTALSVGSDELPLADRFTWYEDATRELPASEIKALADRGAFLNAIEATKLAYSSSHFWFRFELENKTSRDELYLDALLPTLQDFHVYKVGPTGEILTQDIMDRRYPLARLTIAPGERAEFLAMFRTFDTLMFPFSVKTADGVAKRDFEDTVMLAMFLGVVFALVLYNLFLYLSLRYPEFLFYILFTVTNAGIALVIANFPPGIKDIGGVALYPWMPYIRALAPLTTFMFAKAFLQSEKSYPVMNKILTGYLWLLLAVIVSLGLTGRVEALSLFEDVYFLLGIVLLIGAGFHALRKGFGPAKYFLLGLSAFFIGIALYLVLPALPVPANIFTLNAHIIGQALEMVLMSLALASFVKQLERDKARSEATLQVKSRLLRIISHDIVNPLSIIFGFAHILAKKYPTDDSVERILRSAEAIEKVATYVRKTESTKGIGQLQLERVSLKKCFDELAFLFEHFAQEKCVTLTFELSGRDIYVASQEVCLRNEILGNLISNAIKFSFVGTDVVVKAEMRDDKVRIMVKDRGVGMPKEVIAGLFDPARNLSRQGTSGEIGNGYGMPIVHSFVTDYGGSIEVRSVPFDEDRVNCGTEVILTLLRSDSPHSATPVDRRPK